MSKSKGNIVEPFTTIEEYGADTVRFYLPYVSPVWTPLKFDMSGLKEVYSKFFNPLRNSYTFFATYANIDKIDKKMFTVPYNSLEEIDKWLLSKYNRLIKDVTTAYDEYDLNKVVKYLTTFVSEDLSNWYIRRNRDRFWGNLLETSKIAVYQTTYTCLVGVSKLLAPISPFISEEIYRNLTGEVSVHLSKFPLCNESLINKDIETRMDLVRNLISLGRNKREEVKIKVRQPISEVILDGKLKYTLEGLEDLIKEELNVKSIIFKDDLSDVMDFIIRPNFKVAGKVIGNKMKEYQEFLSNLSLIEKEKLLNNATIKFNDLVITNDLIEVKVQAKEGFDVAMDNGLFIILNTTLTDDLLKEGIARELVSKVQNLRKEKGFDIENRITLYYNGDNYFEEVLKDFGAYIKKETLATDIIKKESLTDKYVLNDTTVYLDVSKN